MGSQWTSTRASTTTVLIFSLFCLSGDIELNPGPVKYPCKVCDRSVKSNQQGIQCECCYSWLHAKCIHMSTEEYQTLSLSDDAWCCPDCLKQALPFHDCSHLSFSSSSSILNKSDSAHSPKNSKCSIYYTNCRSLPPKIDELRVQVASCNPEIVAITASWLDPSITNSEIMIPGYMTYRRDRNRNGGGLVLFVKDSLPVSSISTHDSIEFISILIRLPRSSLLLGLFYNPPSVNTTFSELDQAFEQIPSYHKKVVVLLGDFNINLLESAQSSQTHCSLLDFAAKHNLHQIVSEPTRVTARTATLIDHVYVSDVSLVESCGTSCPLSSSDHRSIKLSLAWAQAPVRKQRRLIWRYGAADFEAAKDELALVSYSDFSPHDVNLHWAQWKNVFLNVMNKYIPSKTVISHRCLPWLSQGVRILMQKRDRLFCKAKQSKQHSAWEAFRKARNRVVGALRTAKSNFYEELSNRVRSPKQFWSVYRSFFPKKDRLPALMIDGSASAVDSQGKCDLFASHFSSFFNNSTLTATSNAHSLSCSPGLSSVVCDSGDVYKAISRLPTFTASGPDGISSKMLKGTSDVISSSLATLFNLSLAKSVVPSFWKVSNVVPVYKTGDPKLISNYRPISLLSLVSKLLERIIHCKLLDYLLSNSILSNSQFGFRPGSSTQEALITATGDWHRHLEDRAKVAAIFFDLSKAFDSVPHQRLLSALSAIGISGQLHSWFTNYLTGRSQQVVQDGCSSRRVPVTSGVPQGSILGPQLFSIYINPLASVPLSCGSKLILYADDILLYKPIHILSDVVALQSDVDSICSWISSAGLKLNPKKSKLLVISRQKNRPDINLFANGTRISNVQSVVYLGVTLSQDLSFATHMW